MFPIAKKIIPIFLTLALISGIFPSIFYLKEAKAQIPGTSVPIYIMGSSPIWDTAQQAKAKATHIAAETFIKKVIEKALAVLLETLRKQLLDHFVDSIIKWIQGVDEKPMFVTNWRKFLSDVAGEAVGEYIETTKLAFLCQPFDFQIRVSLPQPGRPPLPTCTLNQIVGNIEDFYEDFRNGGWIAYNEMLYPWNNPYGAYLMALEGEAYEAAAALAEKQKETEQSQGFLNTKRCKKCVAYSDTVAGPIPHPGETPEQCEAIKNSGLRDFQCLEEELTTPGGLIAGQVQQALNVDIDYILSSKDFEVYAAAILDALINRLFRAGVNGLLGILTPNAQEDLGYEVPSGLNYGCDEDVGTCALDPDGIYDTLDTCKADCKVYVPPPETCDGCKGTFVRGRGQTFYQLPNTDSCSGAVVKDACVAFCIHTADTLHTRGNPRTFTKAEMEPYQALFDQLGFAIPETCRCDKNDPNQEPVKYGAAGGDSLGCHDCVNVPVQVAGAPTTWAVCKTAGWCDENCSAP